MGTIVSVVSGKGGTGKSTIAASLGITAARQKKRVLLADLDAGLCSLDLFFHMQDRIVYNLGDVCSGRCTPADAVFAHMDNPYVSLVCAPAVNFSDFHIADVLPALREYQKQFDLIFLDMPAGISAAAEASNLLSDETLVVVTPDLISVRDAQRLAAFLPLEHVHLLINKVSRSTVQLGGLSDLDEAVDMVGVPLLGVLPLDIGISGYIAEDKRCSPLTRKIFSALIERLNSRYVPLILKTVP